MKQARRNVELVSEHPFSPKGDRPRVFGYSAETIAAMTNQCKTTVKRHIKTGKLNINSLSSVTAYITARKPQESAK